MGITACLWRLLIQQTLPETVNLFLQIDPKTQTTGGTPDTGGGVGSG